jgi:hypothetical protein
MTEAPDYWFGWPPDGGPPALPRGAWVAARDGDLPTPVWLRINQDRSGRFLITGILIGEESEPAEVTSQTLRGIKLREVLSAMLSDYDPHSPPDWTKFADLVGMTVSVNAELGHVATGQPRGPDVGTLQAFARTYMAERARQPQRAMTAAAEAHNISRATANRWAQECRKLGYLPST